MKKYYDNAKHNRAATVLASMSPDMVKGIISLVLSKGDAIVSDIADDENGPSRPYAIFSEQFITDEDFPEVFLGMSAIFVAQLRKLDKDNDFYERVLHEAFYIPKPMAAEMAKKIETYDIIGGTQAAIDKTAWYTQLGRKFQEGVRRAVNFVPSVLGINWENDQAQSYDIDFLYEVKLFGRAVNELQSRANLMRSQAALAASAGLFNATSGIYGDVTSDPVDTYELAIHDHMKPEMGTPLPGLIFGGLKKLVSKMKETHDATTRDIADKAGLSKNGGARVDSQVREAASRVLSNNPGPVMQNYQGGDEKAALENAIAVLTSVANSYGQGDVANQVAELYGDAAAESWAAGDVTGTLGHIMDMAGDRLETTGDPDYDQELIASTVGAYGDAEFEGALDSEMGGLFKRARANHQIKKANRRARKVQRKTKRINRRNSANARLTAAKDYAANQAIRQDEIQQPSNYYQRFSEQFQHDGEQLEDANPELNTDYAPGEDNQGDQMFMELGQ